MNCTICKKPVEKHGEGREMDRCVAEKLGWEFCKDDPDGMFCPSAHFEYSREWYKAPDDSLWCCSLHSNFIPHYSSPEMSAETWGLVEKMLEKTGLIELGGCYDASKTRKEYDFSYGGKRGREDNCFYEDTATLAICRAFLAKEDKNP